MSGSVSDTVALSGDGAELHADEPKRSRKCCAARAPRTRPVMPPSVSLRKLLSALPTKYRVYMAFGGIAAALQGAVFPVFSLVFGQLFNIFVTETPDGIRSRSSGIAGIFVGIGLFNLATGYVSHLLYGLVGEACGVLYRRRLWSALLRQDVGYVDDEHTGAFVQRLGQDVELLQTATGTKLSTWLTSVGQVLSGIIIAFIFSWKLTLVLISISPLILLGGWLQGLMSSKGAASQSAAFSVALSFAVEVIASFRTVASFVWQDYADQRYREMLARTKRSRRFAINLLAFAQGMSMFLIFAVYALGFWYGAQLVADTPANGGILLGDMLIVFFSVIMAAVGVSGALQVQSDFARARTAGHAILAITTRVPAIDPLRGTGVRDVQLRGAIELRDVHFSFPSRPAQPVLRGVSLRIPHGTVVGIMGASGSGKSTVVALLERFYDVGAGAILIDDVNVRDYDLHWLRRNIGLVSQEPRLFDMSVEDNIRVGKPDATHEEVVNAAVAANCHDFVMALKDQYATRVGEGGGQLSGGQKQRVAIARAFIKNPKILLLDEATSALDAQSEAVVQAALDKLMVGRTTIQVAHRLSTIRACHVICVMRAGAIVESGSHAELLQRRGAYYALVSTQMEPDELLVLGKASPPAKRPFDYHDLYDLECAL